MENGKQRMLKKHSLMIICLKVIMYLFVSSGFAFATELEKKANKVVKKLLDGREKITVTFEAEDFKGPNGVIYPFSGIWREYLAQAFTQRKATIVALEEEAEYLVSGRYWREKDRLVISTRLVHLKSEGYQTVAVCQITIPWELVKSFFTLDLSFYASLAGEKVLYNTLPFLKKKVLVASPLRFKGEPVYPLFSKLFIEELKTYLSKRGFVFLGIKEFSSKLRSLKRGIKVLGHKKHQKLNFYTLSGSLWPDKKCLRVFIELLSPERKVISQAKVVIPKEIIPKKYLMVSPTWKAGSLQKTGKLFVEILPEKGEASVYYKGESVFFVLWLNRPAFVHIYDYNPKGKIVLLYPCAGDQGLLSAGVHFLPEEREWEISAPFGIDRVLVFASDTPLKLPVSLNCGEELKLGLNVLYEYYRQAKCSGLYAEAVATIKTVER